MYLKTCALVPLLLVVSCSADIRPTSQNSEDDAMGTLQRLVAAIQVADRGALQKLTNDGAYKRLTQDDDGTPVSDEALKARGEAWSHWETRVVAQSETVVEMRMGPAIKEHTLTFAKVSDRWVLTSWTPGE